MSLRSVISSFSFLVLVLTFFFVTLVSRPALADSEWFWSYWSDGNAEVNQYTLVQPRYGQERVGRAILIYVTEPFSISKRVKVDQYDEQNPDHTIALKLNIIESWRTGVYEYRLMTSHFYDARRLLSPLKVTFNSQEWCGASHEKSQWMENTLSMKNESYFEGESLAHQLSKDLRFTDQLFVYGRGLFVGGPQQIESLPTIFLESAKTRFLHHRQPVPFVAKVRWTPARKRHTENEKGEVRPLYFTRRSGVGCSMDIEVSSPYRVMGWSCDDGERAILETSQRVPYWRLTRLGDEDALLKPINKTSK